MNQFEQSKQNRRRFAPKSRFAAPAPPATPFRGAQETELERLKGRLLQAVLQETADPELNAPLRRAANEAAALAWATWYPLLFFPTLFEEKAQMAARQASQQAEIRQRSREVMECLSVGAAE